MTTVRLGYTVGAGEPVDIPLKHMAVTGMTQEAGKTTALEALIDRSGLRAVTFITKRGEGSFRDGRRIPPFFRERADWVFVSSLIDATLGEKNKLLRAWLMKVCRNTHTLAEVQRNVTAAKATARGFSESIYTEIEGYLELVVPQLAQLPPARQVVIGAGLNVMDLSSYSSELQGLVIRSVLEHVYDHEDGVVTVIPEAWEFLPEGRGSPVKLAAETLIRKGAGLKNYMWVDSQDLGGVWKLVVRACPVVLVGVQREANEIKRTLGNLPASTPKLTPADIATLELGQFYACWGRHAIKTYVQPEWLLEEDARRVAMGRIPNLGRPRPDVPTHQTVTHERRGRIHVATIIEEDAVTSEDAARLTRDNERLVNENKELLRRIEILEHHGAPERRQTPRVKPDAAAPVPSLVPPTLADDLYAAFKARLTAEAPALIRVLVTRPELEVVVTRKTLTLDEYSLKGRIAKLLVEQFFVEPRGCGAIRSALKRTGPDANTANIGRAMDDFVREGFCTDEGAGYQVVASAIARVVEAS